MGTADYKDQVKTSPPASPIARSVQQDVPSADVSAPTLAVAEAALESGADVDKGASTAAVQLSTLRRVVISISLSFSILLVGLDTSIVTTVIPKISHEFNALSSAAWIATAYMVTLTALQPLFGRLSDIFGRAPSLISSIVLFIAGSAAAGWAKSMGGLIFGRALQGVGGAGVETMVFTIISDITSEKERPV
ncbi:hypothetical protein GGI24_003939, partial [Coemansia furcata]